MKNTGKCKIAMITAVSLAITFLIGTGMSDARKLTSINRAAAMRATAIRAHSFAGKSGALSIKRAGAVRANAVNAQSSGKKRRHTLQGLALLGASAVGGASFTTIPPIHFPGRTLRPPSERVPDPSDIPRWDDVEHVPGRDMIDSRYLGGPDRQYDSDRDWQWGTWEDYQLRNQLDDISHASCLWDAATSHKMFDHWGGPGNPMLDNDTDRGNWRCGSDDKGGKDNGSGGTDTSDSKKDNTKATKETVKEAKVVKEDSGKKGDKGSPGSEGDDPDELRSPIAQEMEAIDMLAGYDSRNRGSGNDRGPSLTRTGTNTPRGLPHAREHRVGPRHENRPDVAGSPASGLAIANSMSYAASPTPDGGSNPPPGPEYNPVASATSAAAGSAVANQMGYASSAAVGAGGKDPGPPPGPEF
jgi:hypothetical protein